MATLTAQLVGGPTAVLEYAGLRWLTDPSLSPPGEYEGGLVKTTGPAVNVKTIEPIDVVLLSHDHHSDNLDPGGREFLPRARRVLTTVDGARRLGGNATGLEPWSSVEIDRPHEPAVTVTAVPAQHGPDGTDHITGPVIGFLLGAPGLENVYVSGDNASLDVVRTIAERAGERRCRGPLRGSRTGPPPLRRRLPDPHQRTSRRGRKDPRRPRNRARPLRGLDPLHPGRPGPPWRVRRQPTDRPPRAGRARSNRHRLTRPATTAATPRTQRRPVKNAPARATTPQGTRGSRRGSSSHGQAKSSCPRAAVGNARGGPGHGSRAHAHGDSAAQSSSPGGMLSPENEVISPVEGSRT